MTAKSMAARRKRANSPAIKRAVIIGARFLLVNIIFFTLTSLLVVLYGPFANIRSAAIGAIGTSRHAYLLGYIMSPEQIRQWAPIQGGGSKLQKPVFQDPHSDEVNLQSVNSSRFNGFLLEVRDPTRVRVGVTPSLGVRGETTSGIARNNGAVAAVNAGGFLDPLGTGTGRTPYGVIIRNGYFLYGAGAQEKVQLIGFNNAGVLITGNYTLREIRAMNVREGVSFGPTLILNGKKQVTNAESAKWGLAPRTAIGQRLDGTILLLVIDGRQTNSLGATLLDVQNTLHANGAWTAANLDGGSSTTMYFDGKVINNPCGLLGERMVPTAMIVI